MKKKSYKHTFKGTFWATKDGKRPSDATIKLWIKEAEAREDFETSAWLKAELEKGKWPGGKFEIKSFEIIIKKPASKQKRA